MRWRFLGGCAVASVALLLAIGGCADKDNGSQVASVTGTGSPSAGTSDDAAEGDNYDKALKFAQCMREHGIDMEDPEPGGGVRVKVNGDKEKMQAAQQACSKYAPFGDKGPKQDPQMAENMRKFAKCMRDNGVANFPDPESGSGIRIDDSITKDPEFAEAQKKCEKEYLPDVGTKKKVNP